MCCVSVDCITETMFELLSVCLGLRAEIEQLRSETGVAGDDLIGASLVEIASLRDKLVTKETEMQQMTR